MLGVPPAAPIDPPIDSPPVLCAILATSKLERAPHATNWTMPRKQIVVLLISCTGVSHIRARLCDKADHYRSDVWLTNQRLPAATGWVRSQLGHANAIYLNRIAALGVAETIIEVAPCVAMTFGRVVAHEDRLSLAQSARSNATTWTHLPHQPPKHQIHIIPKPHDGFNGVS